MKKYVGDEILLRDQNGDVVRRIYTQAGRDFIDDYTMDPQTICRVEVHRVTRDENWENPAAEAEPTGPGMSEQVEALPPYLRNRVLKEFPELGSSDGR